MVPIVTPRERWERYFTHSKNCDGSALTLRIRVFSSSQVELIVSHTSVVSVPAHRAPRSRARRSGRSECSKGWTGRSP